MHEGIERRQREEREQSRGDEAADHHDCKRAFDLRSVQTQHEQWQLRPHVARR
jgi:hypothetical protein